MIATGALAIAVFYQTAAGKATWEFIKAARGEMRKVVWPNNKETIQVTLVVFAMVVLVAPSIATAKSRPGSLEYAAVARTIQSPVGAVDQPVTGTVRLQGPLVGRGGAAYQPCGAVTA